MYPKTRRIFSSAGCVVKPGKNQAEAKSTGKGNRRSQRLRAIRGEQVECTKLALPTQRTGIAESGSEGGGWPCKVNVASVNIARHWGTMGKVPASVHFCPERCIMQRQSSRKEPEKKPRKHRRKISYAKSRK